MTYVVLLDELDLIVTERSYNSWAAVGSTTAAAGNTDTGNALLDSGSLDCWPINHGKAAGHTSGDRSDLKSGRERASCRSSSAKAQNP